MRIANIIIFACLSLFAKAQVGYIFTEVDSVLIGETFDFKLEFSGLAQEDIVSIKWDTFDKLQHRSLIDSNLYDVDFELDKGNFKGDNYNFDQDEIIWTKDDQSTPPTFFNNFKMTVWELCILGIPGPIVMLKSGQEIQLPPRYVYVKDPLMQTVKGPSPSETIIRQEISAIDLIKEYLWLIILILAIVIGLFFGKKWLDKYRNRPINEEKDVTLEPIIFIPAHVIALEKLETLRRQKKWEKGEDKIFASELTEIIREYIENRFGVLALEMTTQEITAALEKELLESEQMNHLQNTSKLLLVFPLQSTLKK